MNNNKKLTGEKKSLADQKEEKFKNEFQSSHDKLMDISVDDLVDRLARIRREVR